MYRLALKKPCRDAIQVSGHIENFCCTRYKIASAVIASVREVLQSLSLNKLESKGAASVLFTLSPV